MPDGKVRNRVMRMDFAASANPGKGVWRADGIALLNDTGYQGF